MARMMAAAGNGSHGGRRWLAAGVDDGGHRMGGASWTAAAFASGGRGGTQQWHQPGMLRSMEGGAMRLITLSLALSYLS
jgi:hypothetical protein